MAFYVFFYTVCITLIPCLAQDFIRTETDLETITNETTLLSATSPLASALDPQKELLKPLLEHITFISRAAQTSATAARENTTTPVTTTCNYRGDDRPWNSAVGRYFRQRSWGPVDDDCVTDVYGAGADDDVGIVGSDERGSDSRSVFEAVMAHAQGVNSIAKDAASNAGLGWPAATRAAEFGYSVRTQTCVHEYAGFVRREGEWFVTERVTNDDKDLTLGEGKRQFMHEYLRMTDGELRNALVEVKIADEDAFGRGTTSLTKDVGAVTASEFREIFPPDNFAVRAALRAGEHSTQQASDATTPSNIAILALPLAMNVVPVALIADVNTWGMLLYTLLTDVLTTIPLLIKGIEVLAIGVDSNVAVVTRVTGANLVNGGNKAGEVWVAECRANGDLTATGVALIVVSLGFMVGGVVAEMLAKRWVKKRGGKTAAGLVMAGVVGTARSGRHTGTSRTTSSDKNV